jgi:hypothetical protein
MKTKITLDNPIHFFVPFSRVDEEQRVVEGYCYVNARVASDKWNLKRSALEKATQRYMEMPAVRAMHQPIAAGLGLGAQWDDKGCLLRIKVVDDQEWRKVREKVYRGFSIGGRPLIVRGNEVEEFEWTETSLVDRPADPEAVFTMVRLDDAGCAYDVVVEDDADSMTRAETAETLPSPIQTSTSVPVREELAGGDLSSTSPASPTRKPPVRRVTRYAHRLADGSDCLHPERGTAIECRDNKLGRVVDNRVADALLETPTFSDLATELAEQGIYQNLSSALRTLLRCFLIIDDADAQHQSIDEFGSYLHDYLDEHVAALVAGDPTRRSEVLGLLERFDSPVETERAAGEQMPGDVNSLVRLETSNAELVQRLQQSDADLAKVRAELEAAQTDLTAAKEEVQRLQAQPAPQQKRPLRFGIVERTFAVNEIAPELLRRTVLEAEHAVLTQSLKNETDQLRRQDGARRLIAIEMELNRAS